MKILYTIFIAGTIKVKFDRGEKSGTIFYALDDDACCTVCTRYIRARSVDCKDLC
jgi:hypothetical protein